MPYLHIRISGPRDAELAQQVSKRAVDLTAVHLKKERALPAVVIEFIEPDGHGWSIGGDALKPGGIRSYHWFASITDETNTLQEKAAYLAAVHAAMDELLDGVAEHSYVHVADVRAGAYGYGGRTQADRYRQPA